MSNNPISKSQRVILITLCLVVLMLNLDVTVVNLALPGIATSFSLNIVNLSWVISSFIIANAGLVITSGRLVDQRGYFKILFLGILIFLIASVLASLAPFYWVLLLARALQGVGMALAFPAMFAAIPIHFDKAQQGYCTGIILSMMGIGQSIGPSLGGLLIEFFNWRAIFLINIPVCIYILFSLKYSFKAIKINHLKLQPETTNYKSVIGLVLSVSSIFMVISLIDHSQNITSLLSFSILAVIGLFIFIVSELRSNNPLIDFSLYYNKKFVFLNIVRIILQFSFISLLFLLGLLLQNIMNYSTTIAGLLMLGITIVFALLSPLAGRFVDKWGPANPIMVGMFCLALGLLGLVDAPSLARLIISFIVIGVGLSLTFSPTMAAMQYFVVKERIGVASGIILTNTWLGGGIGITICVTIMQKLSQKNLFPLLKEIIANPSTELLHMASLWSSGSKNIFHLNTFSISLANRHQLTKLFQHQFYSGFNTNITICAILCFIAAIIATRLKNKVN